MGGYSRRETRVRARGRLDGATLQLSSDAGSVQALSAGVANTFGGQRVIVILVNFLNDTSQPYTVSAAASTTFQQTN